MTTTVRQNQEFLNAMIEPKLLEQAVEWIGLNLVPEVVFSRFDLESWAEDNGYIKELK